MDITAYIDSDKRLHIYSDGVIVAAGLYHDNLVNQRVQVNGNIVKVIGEDGPIGATCAYCYRIVGTNMADYWIENY